jgi:hypothetical protein
MSAHCFGADVIAWQRAHGRHDLPWQGTRDPYRIWLAEIMLQQTQVATVISYYLRFLDRFADVGALASAPLDAVMTLWSGLGYYSRARNLHRCAQRIVDDHGGQFPASAEQAAASCRALAAPRPRRLQRWRTASAWRFSMATSGGCWRGASASQALRASLRSSVSCGIWRSRSHRCKASKPTRKA